MRTDSRVLATRGWWREREQSGARFPAERGWTRERRAARTWETDLGLCGPMVCRVLGKAIASVFSSNEKLWQTFSEKGQVTNRLGVCGHTASVGTTSPAARSAKAGISARQGRRRPQASKRLLSSPRRGQARCRPRGGVQHISKNLSMKNRRKVVCSLGQGQDCVRLRNHLLVV